MGKITSFKSGRAYEVDMCHGPLTGQMIRFSIPLIISGVLQLLFHAADLIVIGRFASHEALAAVGATTAVTFLLVNIFFGLSVGTNVLVARYLGEKNRKDISRTVHTAIMISLTAGAILAVTGIVIARPALKLMETPDDILDMAVLYMWIYFGGMPVVMLYNFGSAILRAQGDTTRPFYFLLLGGVINVLLNLFFVLVCHWHVAGVALATVISQGVSALLIMRVLMAMRGPCRIKLQGLHIEWKNLREMMSIGIPAGFQAACFSLANILIQSSINTFGSLAIAGLTASGTLESIGYITMNAVGQTVVSFVGQNYGGKKFDRMKRCVNTGLLMSYISTFIISVILLLYGRQLLHIFNADSEVIGYGMRRFYVTSPLLFVCAFMEIFTAGLRGTGCSLPPTLVTIFCACILRIIWIYTIFRWYPTIEVLMASWPFTWVVNCAGVALLLRWKYRQITAAGNG
ncbi:MAG: MATE family efflux transporter [Lentisphaerae bacterium]|nr:MATE family efflux transporter [Lentisphaerota bacterium]